SAELVAVDHGDREHELDLLLERVEGLAGDGADGEHGAEPRRDRGGATDRTGGRDPPARGTDELHRKLVTCEVGVLLAQRLDAGPDRGFARGHDLGEAPQQRLHLDGQAVWAGCTWPAGGCYSHTAWDIRPSWRWAAWPTRSGCATLSTPTTSRPSTTPRASCCRTEGARWRWASASRSVTPRWCF